GDPNLYRYVRNSPTNFTDPSGLDGQPVQGPPPGASTSRDFEGLAKGMAGARSVLPLGQLMLPDKLLTPLITGVGGWLAGGTGRKPQPGGPPPSWWDSRPGTALTNLYHLTIGMALKPWEFGAIDLRRADLTMQQMELQARMGLPITASMGYEDASGL